MNLRSFFIPWKRRTGAGWTEGDDSCGAGVAEPNADIVTRPFEAPMKCRSRPAFPQTPIYAFFPLYPHDAE